MFETLSDRLQEALGDVRSRGTLSEEDVTPVARGEVRAHSACVTAGLAPASTAAASVAAPAAYASPTVAAEPAAAATSPPNQPPPEPAPFLI